MFSYKNPTRNSSLLLNYRLPASTSAITTAASPTKTGAATTTVDVTNLAYPTATELPGSGNAAGLCYSSVTDSVDWVEFSYADYEATVEAFCAEDYTISPNAPPPGNDVAYMPPGANYNVIAAIDWTNDQTGCGTEEQWELTGSLCDTAWYVDFYGCECNSSGINQLDANVFQAEVVQRPVVTAGAIFITLGMGVFLLISTRWPLKKHGTFDKPVFINKVLYTVRKM